MRARLPGDDGEVPAPAQAVDLERRARPDPLERRETGLACQRLGPDLAPVGLLVERDREQYLSLVLAQRAHVLVEALDRDGTVRPVQARDDTRQRPERI